MNNYFKEVSKLSDETLRNVKSFLFYNDAGLISSDGWESDINEEMEVENVINDKTTNEHGDWLASCKISCLVNLDYIVLARLQNFVVLQKSNVSKRHDIMTRASISSKEDGGIQTSNDYISALHIFNITPTTTTMNSIDWVCICIGTSSGYLHFYTERGVHIFREQIAPYGVLIRQIRLGFSHYPGNVELAVIAQNKCLTIEGLSLFATLNTARSQIARNDRTEHELSSTLQLNSHHLKLDNLKHISEFNIIGLKKPGVFDQYVTASQSADGQHAKLMKSSMPTYQQYIAFPAKTSSYACFLWDDSQPSGGEMLTEAFYTLTSNIASQLPSVGFRTWLGLGTSRRDKPDKKHAFEMSEKFVPQKNGIRDVLIDNSSGRNCDLSYIAPSGWPLIVVTDSTARVILINTHHNQIIRVWKGYRNAKCSWVESSSSLGGSHAADKDLKTLFLVIFVPRLGILEVWPTQNGPRAIAIKADGKGSLLHAYFNDSFLGSSRINLTNDFRPITAAYLSSEGVIYQIDVPFHYSVVSEASSNVYDECLIKECRIQRFFSLSSEKNTTFCSIDIEGLFLFYNKLRGNGAKCRFIELIIFNVCKSRCKANVEQFYEFLEKVFDETQVNKTDVTSNNQSKIFWLSKYLASLKKICRIYLKLNSVDMSKNPSKMNKLTLDKIFLHNFTLGECSKINDVMNLYKTLRLRNTEVNESLISSSIFQFYKQFSLPVENEDVFSTKNEYSVNDLVFLNFSNPICIVSTIFTPFLFGHMQVNILFDEILSNIKLEKERLLELFIDFWLDLDLNGCEVECILTNAISIVKNILSWNNVSNNLDVVGSPNLILEGLNSCFLLIGSKIFSSCNTYSAYLMMLILKVYYDTFSRLNTFGEFCLSPTGETQMCERFQLVDSEYILLEQRKSAQNDFTNMCINHLRIMCLLKYACNEAKSLSLENLISNGYGFYGGIISKWVSTHSSICPYIADIIVSFLHDSSYEAFAEKFQLTDSLKHTFTENAHKCFCEIRELLPNLNMELVIGECCWESIRSWHASEPREIQKLELSIEFLSKLKLNPRVQHGLAKMCWNMFLHSTFETLIKKFDERSFFDKNPRSLLNFESIELNSVRYARCVRKVLQILADSCREIGGKHDLNYEKDFRRVHENEPLIEKFITHPILVDYGFSDTSRLHSRNVLTEIADKHSDSAVNYHLVGHHLQLAAVAELQLAFCVNDKNPLYYFDPIGCRAFFQQLSSHPYLLPNERVDDRLNYNRQKFVEQILESVCTSDQTNESFEARALVKMLSEEWGLDIESLKIQEAKILYLSGLDAKAEDVCSRINDSEKLAKNLIPLIAGRLKVIFEEENQLQIKICQHSAAREETISFIKNTPNELTPNFATVKSKSIQTMIQRTRIFITRDRNRISGNKSVAKESILQEKLHILKEFDQICLIVENLRKQ